jgi:serine/threonine-protein kinase HipA
VSDSLQVWVDADFLTDKLQIGTLTHDRGAIRFAYDPSWLQHPLSFAIDPDLSLGEGVFHPKPEQGNFRVFDDSAPDRWGQMLMKRREALSAKDERRAPRTLYAWGYLIGVQDFTRQGALRLGRAGESHFLADHPRSAPPVANLRELEVVAGEITAKCLDDLDALRRWLAALVAPGASLGGARPKANFTDTDQNLWIAKFPAKDDERDIGAWESLAHDLARRAGIDVPSARTYTFSGEFHTFCVKRFDRLENRRRFYASAMAMLRKDQSEGTSYLDMAEFLHHRGAKQYVAADLEQLFRRVAFNVAIGNRDDHLRNHGFILTSSGWRLAPAFDVNPNIEKADHVLNIDESDNRPSLATVIDTSEWYSLSRDRGAKIVGEITQETRRWRQLATYAKIARADIELTAVAFAHSDSPPSKM